MFAVIRTGGKQYKVAKDDVIRVEKLGAAAGEQVEIADVLLIGDGARTTLGTPLIAGAKVTATVVEQTRAPKILVFRKKRRKNHRRLLGHRQALSVLRIDDIRADGVAQPAATAAATREGGAPPAASAKAPAKKPAAKPKAQPADKPTAASAPAKAKPAKPKSRAKRGTSRTKAADKASKE